MKERQELLDKIVKEYENRKDDIVQAITELGAPLSLSERVHYQMGLNHFIAARRIG